MVEEYVCSSAHNFTPEIATFFFPSYFMAQEADVAPKVFITKQIIPTNGIASGSNPITRARGTRTIMSQSFRPLNTEEERTLLARGEKTTTP
jgi:hypothetical protein